MTLNEQNRYNFIVELLERERMTAIQKKRLFSLIHIEQNCSDGIDKAISNLITRIQTNSPKKGSHDMFENSKLSMKKHMIYLSSQENKEEIKQEIKQKRINISNTEIKTLLPNRYISPINLYRFLYKYNQIPILKTTCHLIDADELDNILEETNCQTYNFEKHQRKISKAFDDLCNEKTLLVDYKIKCLIRAYIDGTNFKGNNKEKWTTEGIKYNWNCAELRKWAKENPGVPPNPDDDIIEDNVGFELDQKLELANCKIEDFRQLVLYFKNLFHVKSDNTMKTILEQVNNSVGKGSNIPYNKLIKIEFNNNHFDKNIQLFTDVDKVKQTYKKILNIILKCKTDKPEIILSYEEIDKKTISLSIKHKNSVYRKTINNTLERLGQEYTNLIKNQINGLCDFYLKADFGNRKYAKINLWNGKKRNDEPLENFKGVEHILIFKK